MAEYVERETICRAICADDSLSSYEKEYVTKIIMKQTASDVAPVRHGRWINKAGKLFCSECGGFAKWESDGGGFWSMAATSCCPNCGARMDLEEETK